MYRITQFAQLGQTNETSGTAPEATPYQKRTQKGTCAFLATTIGSTGGAKAGENAHTTSDLNHGGKVAQKNAGKKGTDMAAPLPHTCKKEPVGA